MVAPLAEVLPALVGDEFTALVSPKRAGLLVVGEADAMTVGIGGVLRFVADQVFVHRQRRRVEWGGGPTGLAHDHFHLRDGGDGHVEGAQIGHVLLDAGVRHGRWHQQEAALAECRHKLFPGVLEDCHAAPDDAANHEQEQPLDAQQQTQDIAVEVDHDPEGPDEATGHDRHEGKIGERAGADAERHPGAG